MEGTQGQLGTRFADGLGGDNTHGFAFLNHAVGGQVAAIAFGADTVFRLAGEHRTDFDALDRRLFDFLGNLFGDFFARVNEDFAREGVLHIVHRNTAEDTLRKRSDNLFVVFELGAYETTQRAAVFFVDNHIVGHIDETTGEVSGVGRLQGRIGKTFTGTVGRDEVFQHRKSLLEVCQNRVLDNLTAFGT